MNYPNVLTLILLIIKYLFEFITNHCIQNTVLNMVAQPNIATIGKCVESTLLTFCRLIK